MPDFNSTSEAFLNWFKSQPGAQFHADLEITDLRSRNAGRGIIAKADIPADTELFNIPRASVICVDNCELSKKLPKIFTTFASGFSSFSINDKQPETTEDAKQPVEAAGNDDDEMDIDIEFPDPWLDLIIVMIYEYLRGDSSAWKPYFDVLPKEFETLIYWTPTDLSELQSSAIVNKIGKEDADVMFKDRIVPMLNKHSAIFYPDETTKKLSDEEIVELCHRMGSTIMAYAFDLEKEPDEDDDEMDEDGWMADSSAGMTMGMVPMADMLNADAEFNAHLNHGETHLTMTSLRTIPKGAEVLNYYGPLSNSELLRRYGYTSSLHARYDVVEIPWTLIAKVIDGKYQGAQRSKFDEDDEDWEDSFVLERDAGDPDDTGVNTAKAEFTTVPEELETQVIRSIAPAFGVSIGDEYKLSRADRKRLKAAALEIVEKAVEERLKEYKTTVEEDKEVLKDEEKTKGRLKMAVDVRLGEKLLLKEAKEKLVTMIIAAKEAAAGDEPSAKRQRF